MSVPTLTLPASGTTWAQFQAGGLAAQLERLIAAIVAITPTTAPTVAATLSASAGGTVGGLLAPGVYYVNFTETNGIGETTISAESGPITVAVQAAPTGTPTVVVSGSGGALTAGIYFGVITYVDSNPNAAGVFGETTAGTEFTFTQTGTDEPVITFNDGGLPAWASGRNLYLTAHGGASGTEVLAATGITATTKTLTVNPTASVVVPPTVNTTSTNIPKITAFPALQTNNTARNIYLSPPGGGSGSELLFSEGVTASTFTFSGVQPAAGAGGSIAVPPPAANSTALSVNKISMLRSFEKGNLQQVINQSSNQLKQFNSGAPIAFSEIVGKNRDSLILFTALAQCFAEAAVLIDANPGTITPVASLLNAPTMKRVWP